MFLADGAVEDIDSVLVHTPARTVGSGAVVAALATRLGHRKSSLQPPLVLLCRHQLTRKLLISYKKNPNITQARSSDLSNSLHAKVAARDEGLDFFAESQNKRLLSRTNTVFV